MTREELKEHCLRQVESCEMWAKCKGEEPHGKIYEEHKLILELLEQEPILDKIRAEIDNALSDGMIHKKTVLGIIDKLVYVRKTNV